MPPVRASHHRGISSPRVARTVSRLSRPPLSLAAGTLPLVVAWPLSGPADQGNEVKKSLRSLVVAGCASPRKGTLKISSTDFNIELWV